MSLSTVGPGERIFALLLRLYPPAFRARYRDELLAFFRQDREHPRYGGGLLRPLHFWVATLGDLLRTAWAEHRGPNRLESRPSPDRGGWEPRGDHPG